MRTGTVRLKNRISLIASAAVGGYEERRGPLGELFDFCDPSDRFGQRTWEIAESEMSRISLNIALSKASLSREDIDFIVGGDLQNQCVATTLGLSSFDIPFLGVYGACSTCTEALLIAAALLDGTEGLRYAAAVTSSHNSAAERQFRTPIEYGGQRAVSAQWTSTAAGSFILGRERKDEPFISEYSIGKIINGSTSDGANMGAAMSFAAANTVIDYFNREGCEISEIDAVVTGDLGKVGSEIFSEIVSKKIPDIKRLHRDCGNMLYDPSLQDAHSGASGCGTSASVLSAYFLPLLKSGKLRRILFLSTGALMSPSSLLQGESIYGIAPLIRIESPLI